LLSLIDQLTGDPKTLIVPSGCLTSIYLSPS
jgi:hypothetical protein